MAEFENAVSFYKSVIDQDRSAVVICNLEHEIIYMNPAAIANYAKWGGEKLIGQNLLDCHNAQSRERILQVMAWFSKSPEHNMVYTFHNAKQNKDVYMIALREGAKLIGYYEKHEYRNPETMKKYDISMEELCERFEFRDIRQEEADQAVEIETICFPPNEACSEKMMKERIQKAPELFLVAVDKKTGKIAGFLNGISTDEDSFRDAFFEDAGLYNPDGGNVMLLGLDVLPQYRGQGLAREIMLRYLHREREKGRKKVLLTCLDSKVTMYKKMGFRDDGMADSSWGGEKWHEMSCSME